MLSLLLQKLKNERVNDLDALKGIWANLVKTIKALIQMVPIGSLPDSSGANAVWGVPVPGALQRLSVVPQLSTLQFSVWNHLRQESLPSIRDFIYTYRPAKWNPWNWLPPFTKRGHIIDGTQLISFDGQLLSLPGNCRYVIAQDVVDGNFTVAANIADNKLVSISLVDKSGESVEITSQGPVHLNDKAAELPIHETSVHAWRKFNYIGLRSSYGVRVLCTNELKVCEVFVNGYYHNKLRGLLGNANAERYDDWQLPNAHLSTTLTGFVNAFKLQKSCADVSVEERHEHETEDAKSPECENVFGIKSPLRYGTLLIDPKPYRAACEHAVKNAANKQEAACTVALGYAGYCRSERIPVSLPDLCVKCHTTDDNGKPVSRDVDESYSTRAPQKKADIIIVTDAALQAAVLNDLVSNTITDLRHELKARDINDVVINVLGYKKGDKYVAHYTGNGLTNIQKFHLPKSKDENIPKEETIHKIGCEHIDPYLEKLEKLRLSFLDDFALSADARAFREAVSAPFRSSASKIIIAIRSDVLTHSSNPVSHLNHKHNATQFLNLN